MCAGNSLEGGESKTQRWKIQNVVLWKRKQKEWCGNHIGKVHVDRVVELWRVTDRIICLKMELDGGMLNVISAYAPQVGANVKKRKHSGWI